MKVINLNDHPALKLVCWDRVSCQVIERREAFGLYVDRWAHINKEELTNQERNLISSLVDEFGRGYFFPRAHGRFSITKEFEEVAISENEITLEYLLDFELTVNDFGYPGMRNGEQYFWRDDYNQFFDGL